ncbi:Lipopolysaccharide export system protein LptC [Hydrogenovibrio crunogenus]|uniref:Lipopolysaccharide export system protein LptC n=1 Tax=Hydrogenovibrio crunogenus TaxID=39765 RepID=A0A4P7NZ81_9GAMM|nr:LPS export ABC transporter periplasmic protein LptC [Hydrogenovibrio crunogenus]QBZ82998.1 Lipopolysaccharide export system protein LptC [Hydrogenovibrio crunogenus]RUM93268.1 MAG: LPS export ABC transporter periplasmic protein LptC [Thiomicrospira sp.]
MSKKLSVILLFVAALVVLTIAFKQSINRDASSVQSKPLSLTHSWQIFESTSWQIPKLTPNTKQTIIYSDEVFYQNKTKQSRFKNPYIIQDKETSAFTIKSLQGQSVNDQIVHFNGDVVIHMVEKQSPSENKTLKSEQISYNTLSETLTSKVYTEIIEPGLMISGIGFKANMTSGKYRFLSDVKTVYQPQKTEDK